MRCTETHASDLHLPSLFIDVLTYLEPLSTLPYVNCFRTHHLHMQRDGNVVLAQGTRPASEQVEAPLWSTGRPFEDRDCQKCVIRVAVDAQGAALQVLEGRQLVKSVQLSGHPLLAAALQIKGPDDDRP
eukprot:TRINITY_DN4941_c0_g1_i2.p1 TRINITY_DN4941_c0_g1~~TRINITY_DN4941_c0_g1_i2.p1  ORF type:complete len:129 (+),score=11.95 TRINITY_DN4941_c0_g1_i2:563-949(+)